MSYTAAKPLPIWGVAHQETIPIYNITTGKVLTGGLSGLTAAISADDATTLSSTGVTVAELGTTGLVTVNIDATRMQANVIVIKVTSSTTNASDGVVTLYPSLYYLPATDATNKAVLLQSGTGTGQVSLSSGKVRLASDGMASVAPANVDVTGRQTTYDGIISQLYAAEFNQHATAESGGVVTETVYTSTDTPMMSGTVTQVDTNTANKGKMS